MTCKEIKMRADFTRIPDLGSLAEAVRLLRGLRKELAPGSLAIWRIIDHACKHIEQQIRAQMLEQPDLRQPADDQASWPSVYSQ